MAAKNFTAMLILTTAALLVMGCVIITGEALSDCAKDCMPTCLGVKDTTIPQCEDSCETFCKTQGSGPIHIFGGLKEKTSNFDADLFKQQLMKGRKV